MESRIQSRILLAYFLAWRVDAPISKHGPWSNLLDDAVNRVLASQRADGSFGFPNTCDQSLNYMNGLLNDVFIRLHSVYRADPRVARSVKSSADYLWSTQWVPASMAFKYISGDCLSNSSGTRVGTADPAVDLNNLFVTTFSWLARNTGDAAYRQAADDIFTGGVNGAYLTGSKQFNQQYTASFRYLGYR
jgi:hypothetical protein